ncbi:hypothetical protein BHE74_00041009 [Ensete ventricosum]|nr:hypothetical protein BHE74_00041009 [Ensete ventricosum]
MALLIPSRPLDWRRRRREAADKRGDSGACSDLGLHAAMDLSTFISSTWRWFWQQSTLEFRHDLDAKALSNSSSFGRQYRKIEEGDDDRSTSTAGSQRRPAPPPLENAEYTNA